LVISVTRRSDLRLPDRCFDRFYIKKSENEIFEQNNLLIYQGTINVDSH